MPDLIHQDFLCPELNEFVFSAIGWIGRLRDEEIREKLFCLKLVRGK